VIIGGWQRCTLIDFPERIACILFTQGCNLRCPFCHNPELWPARRPHAVEEEEIFSFLKNRVGKLDGVVVSGGEPTLQPDLDAFLRKIAGLGFARKLDTNGFQPDILNGLLDKNLLNFVAVDLKHIPSAYGRACGVAVSEKPLLKTLSVLRGSEIDYELRTTAVPTIHSLAELAELRDLVAGVPRFTIQNFSPKSAADARLRELKPFPPEQLESLRPIFAPIVGKFTIR
jgi:pyruvate formate lyase activating enzyme